MISFYRLSSALCCLDKYMTNQAATGGKSFLSNKPIPVEERLIFALDVATPQQGRSLVERLGDSVSFYKLGLQLFMAGGYYEFIDWLAQRGKKVFADLKFFDVPETVKLAVKQMNHRNISFATVHGNDAMLRAAVQASTGLKILAVTVLTSLDKSDLDDLGFQCNVEQLVLSRARRALAVGCAGVISSGIEARRLREELADRLLIVCPGIRPIENRVSDDQKRTVDLQQAFLNGADYVVVGRPIRDAPDPCAKALEYQRHIKAMFLPKAPGD